ncbi:hypothetical protein HPB50_028512 [Hyalomma asiaticum]|nr:hypothetical protein HPB50_028512 [Hyalomma asiaticum]
MAVTDEMLPAKLALFSECQTAKAMLSFLPTALNGLLRSLLGRILLKVKLDVAGTFSKLIKIDLGNPNTLGLADFNVDLAAKSELRKITKPSHTVV